MGNRVYKSTSTQGTGAQARRYLVDIASGLPTILCEIDPTDSSITNQYYCANAQILKQYNSTDSYYYIHDRLGSVRVIVNDIGDVNNSYTYNPFGETIDYQQTTNNCFMFTGQWYDSETGQYYLRARMYDPALMRFTARDSVRGKYPQPLTFNPYLYCQNNPINYIDRNGMMFEWLLESALEAKLRLEDVRFNMSIYDRSKCMMDALSMMNLQRGAMYDLMIADAENGFRGSIGSAIANITLAGLQAISPNLARIAQVGIFVYENKETIGNILSGNAGSYDYYDLTSSIFGEMLPSDESGEEDD